jgi:1,4-dihydroxy-6-naphthoate synthase
MLQPITLGYSPCPNDTFIFYALVHQKIDTSPFVFSERLEDVQTLNTLALKEELDVTKISCHAYGYLRDKCYFLRSGGAFGRGCGPLVVAKNACSMNDLKGALIAVPGILTTAYLLLNLYDSELTKNTKPMPFDQIIDAVHNKEVDAGVIIHESRFTFHTYGLTQILDLGQWWESETGNLIPLGGIIARRGLGEEKIAQLERLIKESLLYAQNNKKEPLNYIKCHSQELSDDVIRKHIDLYVNDYSVSIGDEGEQALRHILLRAEKTSLIRPSSVPLFVNTPF